MEKDFSTEATVFTPSPHGCVIILTGDTGRAAHLQTLIRRSPYAQNNYASGPATSALRLIGSEPEGLALLDMTDDNTDPLHAIKQIRQHAPAWRILIIAPGINAAIAQRALRAGANAYLTSEESETLLPRALQFVATGERFVSDDVMQQILQGMVATTRDEERIPIEMLSDREMVIFQMIGQGKPLRDIAGELNLNIKTIATHCNNIRRKLHSGDNRHLTRLGQSWVADSHHHG